MLNHFLRKVFWDFQYAFYLYNLLEAGGHYLVTDYPWPWSCILIQTMGSTTEVYFLSMNCFQRNELRQEFLIVYPHPVPPSCLPSRIPLQLVIHPSPMTSCASGEGKPPPPSPRSGPCHHCFKMGMRFKTRQFYLRKSLQGALYNNSSLFWKISRGDHLFVFQTLLYMDMKAKLQKAGSEENQPNVKGIAKRGGMKQNTWLILKSILPLDLDT